MVHGPVEKVWEYWTRPEQDGSTNVVENFEAENIHEAELQRQGWQAILDHFKRYTEGKR